jgi:integrase
LKRIFPERDLKKGLLRIRRSTEIENFHVHDLRRTCASKCAEFGVERIVISKLLNHGEGGIMKIYERYDYFAEKRAALARWDRRLAQIIAGEPMPSNVVELRTA